MAELTLFNYRYRPNALRALDARVKLACLALLSITSLQSGVRGLGIASIAAAFLVWKSAVGARALFFEVRYFLFFLIFICAVRALTVSGDVLLGWAFIAISRQGLCAGALLSWRLLLIVIFALVLSATTPLSLTRAAIEWYLRPIPGVPQRQIGTMIGLMVRFIPVLLAQSRDIRDAQRARAVEQRKNVLYRLTCFGLPLLRRSVVNAERLAGAMEARCYDADKRTAADWRATAKDYWALAGVGALGLLMWLL